MTQKVDHPYPDRLSDIVARRKEDSNAKKTR